MFLESTTRQAHVWTFPVPTKWSGCMFFLFFFPPGRGAVCKERPGNPADVSDCFSCVERSGMGLILTSSLHALLSMASRRQAGSSNSHTHTHTPGQFGKDLKFCMPLFMGRFASGGHPCPCSARSDIVTLSLLFKDCQKWFLRNDAFSRGT